MKVGYARVSSGEQNLALQRDALAVAGCDTVFEDEGVSGTARRRLGLDRALAGLKSGDTLVTWRLDRLGRSLPHLIELVAGLQDRGCGFASLNEAIDTTSAGGKLVFHIMGALAEFERALIVERTRAGVTSAVPARSPARSSPRRPGRSPPIAKPSPAWPRCSASTGRRCGGRCGDKRWSN